MKSPGTAAKRGSSLSRELVVSDRKDLDLSYLTASARRTLSILERRLLQAEQQSTSHDLNKGRLCLQAREIVGHGNFEGWVEGRFSFTIRTAQNRMTAYKVFGDCLYYVDHLPITVIYHLARHNRADLTALVVEKAHAGYVWTAAMVDQIVANCEQRAEGKEKPLTDIVEECTARSPINEAITLLVDKLGVDQALTLLSRIHTTGVFPLLKTWKAKDLPAAIETLDLARRAEERRALRKSAQIEHGR